MPQKKKRARRTRARFSLARIISLFLVFFVLVGTVFAVLAQTGTFDIRNYAKSDCKKNDPDCKKNNKKEEKGRGDPKVSCPSGCDGKYLWYLDRNENKCKKRATKKCDQGTTVVKKCVPPEGTCYTGIKNCNEVSLLNVPGACTKGVCCSRTAPKVNSTNTNSGSNTNQIPAEIKETGPLPCTAKGACISNTHPLPCCSGSNPAGGSSWCASTTSCQ